MKIGEVAQIARCTVETIRYYEKVGLLAAPARTTANFRHYGSDHVVRLRFIRNCRTLDMSQDEIRSLLDLVDQPTEKCGSINAVFDKHIAHIEERMRELLNLKQQMTALRERCQAEQAIGDCGILQGLAAMENEPTHERHTHLG